MKKVIITGVTGQDGSLMVDYLLANTDIAIIAGVRRLSVKNHKNIEHLLDNPRFKLIDLDITDQHNVNKVIAEEKVETKKIEVKNIKKEEVKKVTKKK